jgi:hypothetical protein
MRTILRILFILVLEVLLSTAGLDDFADVEEFRIRRVETILETVVMCVDVSGGCLSGKVTA